MPPSRSAHVAAVYKDKMYIFGGWDGVEHNNDMFTFSFKSRKWKLIQCQGKEAPIPRCSHTAVVCESDKSMYIFGGYGGPTKSYLGDLWKYTFETKSWQEISPDKEGPSPRSRMRITEWCNRLYLLGGWDRQQHFKDFFEFDLDSLEWKKLDVSFPYESKGIGQHSMCVHNNILYVFSGFDPISRNPSSRMLAYRLGAVSAE